MSEAKNVKNIFRIEKNIKLLNKKRANHSKDKEDIIQTFPKQKEIFKTLNISLQQTKKDKENKSSSESLNKIKNNNIPLFKNGKWSEEEDNRLLKYIKEYGEGNWNTIERHFVGRNRKQIRQRYINHLKNKIFLENDFFYNYHKPSNINYIKEFSPYKNYSESMIKNKIFIWDDNLDKILLTEYFLNNKCWVKISQKIPGTTENSVKNRFYSLLRQKVNQSKKEYKYLYLKKNLNKINVSEEFTGQKNSLNKIKQIFGDNISIYPEINLEKKNILWTNKYFETEYFTNKSKKKNYSVKILLEFLPELLEEKKIDIEEIIKEINKRKNLAAKKIFNIIENHFYIYSYLHLNPKINNDECSICSLNSYSTQFSQLSDNVSDIQEKLAGLFKNMKLKIMYNYFRQFRMKTIGK